MNGAVNDRSARHGIPTAKQHKFLITTTIIDTISSVELSRRRGGNRMNRKKGWKLGGSKKLLDARNSSKAKSYGYKKN